MAWRNAGNALALDLFHGETANYIFNYFNLFFEVTR